MSQAEICYGRLKYFQRTFQLKIKLLLAVCFSAQGLLLEVVLMRVLWLSICIFSDCDAEQLEPRAFWPGYRILPTIFPYLPGLPNQVGQGWSKTNAKICKCNDFFRRHIIKQPSAGWDEEDAAHSKNMYVMENILDRGVTTPAKFFNLGNRGLVNFFICFTVHYFNILSESSIETSERTIH